MQDKQKTVTLILEKHGGKIETPWQEVFLFIMESTFICSYFIVDDS